MLTKEDLAQRLLHGCANLRTAEQELTDIDSHFGDADHGLTMVKIAGAIEQGVNESADGATLKDMLDDVAMKVMVLNGGSAVPLWNTWLDGLQEAAPDESQADETQVKAMFSHALEELSDMSGAQVGDKTMMDALIPATEALVKAEGSADDLLRAGAQAAQEGAEASKQFVSKFGRAKSYGEKTLGTPDAGAVSMACFWRGLALE